MGVFQDTIRRFAPEFWQAPNMLALLQSFGGSLDINAQRVFDGRRAGNPYAGGSGPHRIGASVTDGGILRECDPDVLSWHSRDRQIKLYSTEPILSQRQRLSQFRQLHKERGSHWGEIDHVRPYFATAAAFPTIAIVFQDNLATPGASWYQVDSSGKRTLRYTTPSNFNYDDRPTRRTRWWAFLDFSGAAIGAPNTYDSGGIYDTSGWIYDGSVTSQQAADITNMFLDWQAAHSWCAGVIGVWPNANGAPFPTASGVPTQDPTGWWSLPNGANTWSTPVDPGTGKDTRPPNFIWFYDNPAP